jgi:hypothetical protein
VSEVHEQERRHQNGAAHISARADEIEAGSRALTRMAAPATFPQVVALVVIVLGAVGAYFLGTTFVAALDRNTAALTHLTEAVTAHEVAASIRAQADRDRR